LRRFNFFLQYGCYKVLRAILGELASRLLATFLVPVVGVLAEITVPVLTTRQGYQA
jgi:hypothetical protein